MTSLEARKLATPVESQPESSRNGLIALLLMISILAVLGMGLAVWTFSRVNPDIGFKAHKPLGVYGQVPPFKLTERSGYPVGRDDLKGAMWIADFVFTRCAGTCPIMSKSMENVQHSLSHIPQIWPPVRLVSFTVDPEWDTTERLKKYAERFSADPGAWLFVTGKYESIQSLARDGFKLGVQPGSDNQLEPIIHSQSLVLVDPQGRIRGYYDGTDPAAVRLLLADVMRLNREIASARS